ncbi:hypothetical protein [uncultured Tateyamaria sp.]|uniref:hypothetical protein n=1 Tax=Tateyamaria sp. TaxID=1929288 RepID=UPI002634A40A|nr:hypothetical protein [uncultured Tateyamaria sp.]
MKYSKPILAAATAFLTATTGQFASADEIWDSATGLIIYEVDSFGDAVFSFTSYNGAKANLIIEGFASQLDDRGTNQGYWIGEDGLDCKATLSHPGGYSGTKWGRAVVVWDKKTFPSAFTMTTGDCFGEPQVSLEAEPTVRKLSD